MRSPGEVQQSAGAFGRGGSGSCFRGSGALRWLRGLHLAASSFAAASAAFLARARPDAPWRGPLPPPAVFGAQLDAADRTDAVRTVGRNGLAAFLAEGLGALVDTDRAKAGELAQLQAVQTAVGAGGNADPALAALPRRDHRAGLPSGRSSNLMAPLRQLFSHRPQAKHFWVKLGRW